MTHSLIDKVIDNYRLLKIVGRGGMGVVYQALDIALDKIVAIKMVDAIHADEVFLKGLRGEAKALAKLKNEHIVTIHALRETDSGLCLVMEFVEGVTLADMILERGPIPFEEALPLLKQLLAAIAHAHSTGIIHRDIKPRNVMVTRDKEVKVTDFGLARVLGKDSTMTLAVAGTYQYMSPEQLQGARDLDHRTDIYSLGMTFYEVLAGRTPFLEEQGGVGILKAVLEKKLPSPDEVNPNIPRPLAKIVMKAVERDRNKRFQSVTEFSTALERFESSHHPTDALKSTRNDRPGGFSKITSVLHALGVWHVAALLAVLTLAVVLVVFIRKEKSPTPAPTSPPLSSSLSPSFATALISSEPSGAQVLIDGALAGFTPLQADSLIPGLHSVRIEKLGYKAWRQDNLTLAIGERKSLHATLAISNDNQPEEPSPIQGFSATLVLAALPEGIVSVDGQVFQPRRGTAARVGVHEQSTIVIFRHPQYGEHEATVQVQNGQTKELSCFFESYVNIQSLDVSGIPVWGIITINGETTQVTTPHDRLPLSPGVHEISVFRTGYETVERPQRIEVKPAFSEKVYHLVFHLRKR